MPRPATPGQTVPPTPDPEPVGEVLSSRLTLWKEMLEHESEEAVVEVMETLLKRVQDRCFRTDIKQQMIPYTTNWMKNRLVQIVEQHFLCRDEDDGPDDVPPQDAEPPTAEPDAWAKGCVPLVTPSPPLRPISPKEVEAVHRVIKPENLRKRSSVPQPKVSPKLPTNNTSPKLAVSNVNKYRSSFPPPKTEKKISQALISAKPSKFLPPLAHSAEKKTITAKKSQTVDRKESPSFNFMNKHKAIQKLDPARLPDHCVFPKYEIVDSNSKTQKIRANKPQQKHSKQEPESTVKSQRTEVDVRPKYGTVTSSGPLRLESMTLAKGVTLSQSLDLNQSTASPQTPSVKLRPIRTDPALFKFPVDQFFVADPQVKALSQMSVWDD